MAKLSILAGSTSQTVNIWIQDSSSTTGAGLTGLVYNSAGLTAYYALARAAASAITLATLAAVNSAYSSGGFKEIDATNMPGWYRFDIPDAAIASGRFSSIHLKGAANMAPLAIEIELTATNNQDAVRGGMTALPNANAEAAGGLYTRGSGAGQINQPANGQIDANTVKINGTAQTARDIGASVLLSSGTGAGQVSLTTGKVDVNDKTGFSLSAAGIQAIWDALTSALTTVGSIGKRLADDIDATISSRSTYAGGDTSGTTTLLGRLTAGRATNLDNLDATVSSRLAAAGYTTPPTADQNADALLDRADAIETGWTVRKILRIMSSSVAAKLSGAATTTVTIRNVTDTKDRITATVDANGNRTAVTLDGA